jgi:hypothetical protein
MNRRAWILAAGLALLPSVSQAAAVMFVEGLTGRSRVQGRSGWFDVLSVSWSVDRSNTAAPNSVVVVLNTSAATVTFGQAGASGGAFRKMVFDQVYSINDSNPLLATRLTCDNAVVRTASASASTEAPETASITLQCGILTWENFDYSNQGTLLGTGKATWDFLRNVGK